MLIKWRPGLSVLSQYKAHWVLLDSYTEWKSKDTKGAMPNIDHTTDALLLNLLIIKTFSCYQFFFIFPELSSSFALVSCISYRSVFVRNKISVIIILLSGAVYSDSVSQQKTEMRNPSSHSKDCVISIF